MTDTGDRRRRRFALAVAVGALLVVAIAAFAADPRARAIWVRAGRAYVALPEASGAEPGDSVTFREKKRVLATGRVSAVIGGEVALVTLGSGSLDRVRKLERLLVTMERPALDAPRTLRLGLPSGARANLLFACSEVVPRPPAAPGYRAESLSPRTWRLVRDPAAGMNAAPAAGANDTPPAKAVLWPDTLFVRLFDESSDEEIALERGEVDVAVFWPGELSLHVRRDARWRDYATGTRERGLLAAAGAGGAASGAGGAAPFDSARLAAFNEALFRGDLEPMAVSAGQQPVAADAGIEVDPALPGRAAIENWISRNAARGAPGTPRVRLTYLDLPRDSAEAGGATPLFAIRCPVVTTPGLQRYVRALGPQAFADMAGCAPAARR